MNRMWRNVIIILVLCVLGTLGGHAQKIYPVAREYQADVKVFVVDAEYKADLTVYKTDKAYKVADKDNNGIWYYCDREYQADKKVFFVDREYKSDLTVFFTDREYEAGWNRPEKKPLMK